MHRDTICKHLSLCLCWSVCENNTKVISRTGAICPASFWATWSDRKYHKDLSWSCVSSVISPHAVASNQFRENWTTPYCHYWTYFFSTSANMGFSAPSTGLLIYISNEGCDVEWKKISYSFLVVFTLKIFVLLFLRFFLPNFMFYFVSATHEKWEGIISKGKTVKIKKKKK